MNCDKCRDAFSFLVHPPYQSAGPFWCHHDNIYIGRRNDLSEMNIESMGEHKAFAGRHMGLYLIFVYSPLVFIGEQYLDDLCCFHRFRHRIHPETIGLGKVPALSLSEPYDDVEATILQVQCLSSSLRPVTDNCDTFPIENRKISIGFIKFLDHTTSKRYR